MFFFEVLEALPNQNHSDIEDTWYGWDPDSMWVALQDEHGQYPSEAARDTMNALKSCLTSTAPWEQASIFGHVACGLAAVADLEHVPHPTAGQCIFAVHVMNEIEERSFGEDVVRFWAAVLVDAGIVWAGEPLAAANPLLSHLPGHKQAPRLLANPEQELGDDDPAEVSAAKWSAAHIWAGMRDENGIYDEDPIE